MENHVELRHAYPRLHAAMHGWRRFCRQWRHDLLLVAMFGTLWAFAPQLLPKLDRIRILGGRHPLDVLWLMDDLKSMWVPVAAGIAIYAFSFVIRALNTAAAVATAALACCLILLDMLWSALLTLGFW